MNLLDAFLDELSDSQFLIAAIAIALAYEMRNYIPIIAVSAYAYVVS
ncbi:MAG TPA: hypothetical protein P5056_02960 [Candidatus Paceibacterota bacterium]|nr:hypothetical protein [Candidatus Paceibacterota bacterium]